MHLAVRKNNPDAVTLLAEYDGSFYLTNHQNETPIELAARVGAVAALEYVGVTKKILFCTQACACHGRAHLLTAPLTPNSLPLLPSSPPPTPLQGHHKPQHMAHLQSCCPPVHSRPGRH